MGPFCLFIGCSLLLPQAVAPQKESPVILAVFAHADDETLVGPVLARYARQGARVYLAIVTRGEKWAPQTPLVAGDEIAKVRTEESRCACKELGIQPPVQMGFGDGDLGQRSQPAWAALSKVEKEIRKLLTEIKPDVVITWGPDGGYGHPDHRLVGSVVTSLVQESEGAPRHLLYPGFPKGRLPESPETGALPWSPIDLRYLTVRVPYDERDLQAAKRAFACYKSQFPAPALRSAIDDLHSTVWQGRVYFRPWFGAATGEDLLALKP